MEQKDKQEAGRFMGDGFEPAQTYEEVDSANADGFSLWDSASGTAEGWLQDWEGRQETHDMFHNSYD